MPLAKVALEERVSALAEYPEKSTVNFKNWAVGDTYNAIGSHSIGRQENYSSGLAEQELISFVAILRSLGLLNQEGNPTDSDAVKLKALESKDSLRNVRKAIEDGAIKGISRMVESAGPNLVSILTSIWS